MINNISQIISNNKIPPKITKIYYYCENHIKAGYPPMEIDWHIKNVPICKNCGKFQCKAHITKNYDMCINCAISDNICPVKHIKYQICYCCGKIICDCYRKFKIMRSNGNGSYLQVICDEHYEERKFDPNVSFHRYHQI